MFKTRHDGKADILPWNVAEKNVPEKKNGIFWKKVEMCRSHPKMLVFKKLKCTHLVEKSLFSKNNSFQNVGPTFFELNFCCVFYACFNFPSNSAICSISFDSSMKSKRMTISGCVCNRCYEQKLILPKPPFFLIISRALRSAIKFLANSFWKSLIFFIRGTQKFTS